MISVVDRSEKIFKVSPTNPLDFKSVKQSNVMIAAGFRDIQSVAAITEEY
jgi:hypothetical protein